MKDRAPNITGISAEVKKRVEIYAGKKIANLAAPATAVPLLAMYKSDDTGWSLCFVCGISTRK